MRVVAGATNDPQKKKGTAADKSNCHPKMNMMVVAVTTTAADKRHCLPKMNMMVVAVTTTAADKRHCLPKMNTMVVAAAAADNNHGIYQTESSRFQPRHRSEQARRLRHGSGHL